MPTKTHFLTLDAMRGIAALAVVIFHARSAFPGLWFPGYLAVDLFFMLSGFVIAHAYDDRLRAGMTTMAFTRVRLIRLYPMFIVGALLGSLLAALSWPNANGADLSAGHIALATALSLFFLPNPVTTSLFLTGPLWSLFYEMVANIAYAALHRFSRLIVLIAICAVCLLGLVITAVAKNQIDLGSLLREAPWGILRVGYGFCAGVILYRLRHRMPSFRRLPTWAVPAATGLFLLLPIPRAFDGAYGIVFIAVIAPALVIAGSQVEPGPRQARVYEWLGALSYPLYAIHRPVLRITFAGGALGVPAPLIAVATIIGLMFVCPLIVRYYDTPVRAWLSHLNRRSRPGGPKA